MSGEETPVRTLGLAWLLLMFRKASNSHFYQKKISKTVTLTQVKIPKYKGIDRRRQRGFGALAQGVGKTASPFPRRNVFPAAKRVRAAAMDFAAAGIAIPAVVSGRKSLKSAAENVGTKTLKTRLDSGRKQRSIFREKTYQTSLSITERYFYKHISLISLIGTNLLWRFLETLEGKSQCWWRLVVPPKTNLSEYLTW